MRIIFINKLGFRVKYIKGFLSIVIIGMFSQQRVMSLSSGLELCNELPQLCDVSDVYDEQSVKDNFMVLDEFSKRVVKIDKELKKNYSFKEICKMHSDSVCRITSFMHKYNIEDPYRAPENGSACGSGFFISPDGKILTNFHVVDEAAVIVIQAPSKGKERFEVEYIGGNPSLDVALLQLKEASLKRLLAYMQIDELPCLPLGKSDEVFPGEKVMILGYPLAVEQVQMSEGVVSGRTITHLGECLQTTAAMNPGNSGGPFFNKQGEVIGIAALKSSDAENIGFCIPIDKVTLILEELTSKKIVKNVVWGIYGTKTSEYFLHYFGCLSNGGLYVAEIKKGYLAEKTGLQEGDIITAINQKKLDYFGHLPAPWKKGTVNVFEYLSHFKCGELVTFSICRDRKMIEVDCIIDSDYQFAVDFFYPWHQEELPYEIIGGMVFVKLTKNHVTTRRYFEQQNPWFDFSAVTKYEKEKNSFDSHVIITRIFPTSTLYEAHCFLDGDCIVESINGHPVKTIEDLRKALISGIGQEFFVVQCEQGSYSILPVREMLEQEEVLSVRYGYQKSPLVDVLAQGLELVE